MIKIENNMLVLDSTFSRKDVQAIDEFVKINVDRERQRLIALLHDYGTMNYISELTYHELVALITDSVY
jgi:hypothetical protein